MFHRCANNSGPWFRASESLDVYAQEFPQLGIGYHRASDRRQCLVCAVSQTRYYTWPVGQPDPHPDILVDPLLAKRRARDAEFNRVLATIEATRRDRDGPDLTFMTQEQLEQVLIRAEKARERP